MDILIWFYLDCWWVPFQLFGAFDYAGVGTKFILVCPSCLQKYKLNWTDFQWFQVSYTPYYSRGMWDVGIPLESVRWLFKNEALWNSAFHIISQEIQKITEKKDKQLAQESAQRMRVWWSAAIAHPRSSSNDESTAYTR